MNAIDTNVLVYMVDDTEPVKQAEADALIKGLTVGPVATILPWQVIVEFMASMHRWERMGRLASADPESYTNRVLRLFPVVLPVRDIVATCFDLGRRHSLSHYDAMLLAACIEAGVTTLYSEDLTDGATYDTVTVVNPFV